MNRSLMILILGLSFIEWACVSEVSAAADNAPTASSSVDNVQSPIILNVPAGFDRAVLPHVINEILNIKEEILARTKWYITRIIAAAVGRAIVEARERIGQEAQRLSVEYVSRNLSGDRSRAAFRIEVPPPPRPSAQTLPGNDRRPSIIASTMSYFSAPLPPSPANVSSPPSVTGQRTVAASTSASPGILVPASVSVAATVGALNRLAYLPITTSPPINALTRTGGSGETIVALASADGTGNE